MEESSEVTVPVTFGVLTTSVAFLPLLFFEELHGPSSETESEVAGEIADLSSRILALFRPTFRMRWLIVCLLCCLSPFAHAQKGDPRVLVGPYFDPPEALIGDTGGYSSVLHFKDGSTVKSAADWARRRREIRGDWMAMMGEWPPLIEDPQVEILKSEKREDFTQETVRFEWIPGEKTTGYLLIPEGEGPFPAVVTVYYEPETAIGHGKEQRDFAHQLVKQGFIALSIGTTKATEAKTYALYWPSIDNAAVQPLSMLAYAAANAWHVLAAREDVKPHRIGITGHSFGGKWAMFSSCLFDKFACAAWSDPGIVFNDARPSVNYWEPWYLGYHPRPWRQRGLITKTNPAAGLYPRLRREGRDLHELHALMAPRPFLVLGGSEDGPEQWRALNRSMEVNLLLGFTSGVAMTNRPGHAPTKESNAAMLRFFKHWLKHRG